MNILISGAGGFIGGHLSTALAKNHNIYKIFSTSTNKNNKNCFNIDLTNKEEVAVTSKKLLSYKIDAIIHLASKMSSSDNNENLSLLKDNLNITENIIFLSKILIPKIFINFSSMAVYPNVSGLFNEDSIPNPSKNNDCIYGLSKFASEVMIDFSLRDEKIKISHLRVAQVYGKGMNKNRIIPIMIRELKDNNTITVYGNGERESCFIEINRLSEIIDLFINKKPTGIYNVGDYNISYNQLAQNIIKDFGNKDSVIIKEQNGNKGKFNLNFSKLIKLASTK